MFEEIYPLIPNRLQHSHPVNATTELPQNKWARAACAEPRSIASDSATRARRSVPLHGAGFRRLFRKWESSDATTGCTLPTETRHRTLLRALIRTIAMNPLTFRHALLLALAACLCAHLAEAADPQTQNPKPSPPFAAPDLGADRVIFGKYTGAHAADPAFQKTRDSLESQKAEMLAEIYKLTGLALPAGKKIHIVFNDNPAAAPDQRATTFATTQPHPEGALVTYSLANVHKLPAWVPVRTFLQHELVHAIQLCSTDPASYNRIDPWVKEGIAVYAGGEIPSRVRNHYFACETQRIPPQQMAQVLFDGLTQRGKSSDYLEEALAIFYLARAFGDEALHRFIREITLARRPWRHSLETLTNQPFSAFEAAAKQFAAELFLNLDRALQQLGDRRGDAQAQLQAVNKALASTTENPLGRAPPAAAAPPDKMPPAPPPPPAASRQKPNLGLTAQNSDTDTTGVVITAIASGGIGEQTGLQIGDHITHFNGQPIKDVAHLRELLDAVKFGDTVPIIVVRNGKAYRATLQFGK
jgi:hypothetical protein